MKNLRLIGEPRPNAIEELHAVGASVPLTDPYHVRRA